MSWHNDDGLRVHVCVCVCNILFILYSSHDDSVNNVTMVPIMLYWS